MKKERHIQVVGADANNLADVSVDIPLHKITAIVGISGSGKSSFVEDTLAAEAGVRMKRFVDLEIGAPRHDVRAFVGELPPAILVAQRAFRASSRTTVGTSTALLRVLRRLFIRYSSPFADDISEDVPAASPETLAAWLVNHVEGKAVVWASPILGEMTDGVAIFARLAKAGLTEAQVFSETDRGERVKTGTRIVLDRARPLSSGVLHTIEARVGVVGLFPKNQETLTQLLSRAWNAANGRVFVELPDCTRPELKRAFSFGVDTRLHRVHPASPRVFATPNAHLLSFNAPEHQQSGACPECQGIGVATILDEAALIPHPERSMHAGAFALWTPKNYKHVNIQHGTIEALRDRAGFDPDVPWSRLPTLARALILDGVEELIIDRDPKTKKKSSAPRRFTGFRRAIFERVARSASGAEALGVYVRIGPCHSCAGSRWSSQARALRVRGQSIDGLLAKPFSSIADAQLGKGTTGDEGRLWANVAHIAESFVKVGLGHLSGRRGMFEVSDGESRRIKLAAVLNSRLAGLLIVLDEPGRGLHEQDLVPLGDAISRAAEVHTVVMSEHRQRLVSRVDHLVELGPGAGAHGGKIIRAGPVRGTAWASPPRVGDFDDNDFRAGKDWLEIRGVSIHNVSNANVKIPIGSLTCIAGVSGSGKSSFVRGALVPALMRGLGPKQSDVEDFRTSAATWATLKGAERLRGLHAVDQTQAGAQRRSLVATFLGLADPLRKAFAEAPAATRLGLKPQDFGTNGGHGRCQRCLGLGVAEDDGPCSVCGGLRFGIDVLSVRVGGEDGSANIAECLAEPISQLTEKTWLPFDMTLLRTAVELGIGHLSLGRSLDTLSGGEIQRLRIAHALSKHEGSGVLFVLDEPACGLHPRDVEQLYGALRHIVAGGANTVVIVEHDPYLLARCDYLVEFGPGGGPEGGRVVASDTPSAIAAAASTPTGRALADRIQDSGKYESGSRGEGASAARSPADARRARAEMRQIIGDDVDVPDEGEPVSPSAIVPEGTLGRRAHEIADLDRAICAVALDLLAGPKESRRHLLNVWNAHPEAELRVHPLLDAIATWGSKVPASVVEETNQHLAAMGLGPPITPNVDAIKVRVTGTRFRPATSSQGAREVALDDATAVGNGYVELVDQKEKALAVTSDRLMDIEAGLVGPRRPRPAHFSRLDALGRCPMCSGASSIATINEELLLRDISKKLTDEDLLHPGAAEVLKGIRRSEMLPFFRRLGEEGLWDEKSWAKMTKGQRTVVMHGFWVRPGHGTFLKSGKDIDGSEVGHWLRWDGLVKMTLSQLSRSKDAVWRTAVERSSALMRCPVCDGTGLGRQAKLLRVGGRSIDEWTLDGSLSDLVKSLLGLRGLATRADLTRHRVADCLAPAVKYENAIKETASAQVAHEIFSRSALAFVGLSTTFE